MSVKVEKTDNKNELKMEFTVDAKIFVEGMNTVYKNNIKYFSVPGFRKGKVPMNMVEKFYGEKIFYEDAFNEVVPEIYEQAIKDEKLDVVSQPKIDIVQIEKGKDLIFTAIVQIKPEVKLGEYKGVKVDKNIYKVTDHEIGHKLEEMAEKNSRMISITDRKAKDGDTVVIDFDGSVDGVHFEGGKAENYELKLGSKSFIEGFEDQVVGMEIDEEKDINVKFPEEYFSKELAGKAAVFTVKLHEIKEKELPKIDDELAKDVSEFDTLEELKADIASKMEKENEERTQSELKDSLVKIVTDNAEVDIPSGMVESELDSMMDDMNRRLTYQGFSLDQYLKMLGKTKEEFRNEGRENAEESVKVRLVLEKIGNDEKIEVNEEDINNKIKELAKSYNKKEEELLSNEVLKNDIKNTMKTEKVVELIVENAKIKEVEVKNECECECEEHKPAKKRAACKKSTKKSDEKVAEKSNENDDVQQVIEEFNNTETAE